MSVHCTPLIHVTVTRKTFLVNWVLSLPAPKPSAALPPPWKGAVGAMALGLQPPAFPQFLKHPVCHSPTRTWVGTWPPWVAPRPGPWHQITQVSCHLFSSILCVSVTKHTCHFYSSMSLPLQDKSYVSLAHCYGPSVESGLDHVCHKWGIS